MTTLTKGIYIIAAKRTPFGAFGGKFVKTSACELQVEAAKSALASGNVAPDIVDCVVIGNVLGFTSPDSSYLPRHVSLRSGVPVGSPALGVNRMCGSGFQSIVNAAQNIITGESKIVLTGGVENMSQAPYFIRDVRFGTRLGARRKFEDTILSGLFDSHCQLPMVLTVEKLAEKYNVTRQDADEYAFRSQGLWKKAHDSRTFEDELCPVTVAVKSKEVVVDCDEQPKPQITLDDLQRLEPVLKKDGVVTPGTASGFSDGAGAVVIASEDAVRSNNLAPMARLVAYSVVGVDPTLMGIGPAPAIKKLLKIAGRNMSDIDIIEINEVFSAVAIACAKELDLDVNKVNVNGGAIALGNPFGAAGSRITAHIVHQMRKKNTKFGIGSACLGGGQGMALLFESV